MRAFSQKFFAIVKRELSQYFNTWSAYIIFALVLFLAGLLFNINSLAGEQKYSEKVLGSFFYDYSGIIMIAGLLLSMRLFAEEKQNGTDALLMTAPISDRALVYAKFVASAGFLAVLLAISLYMPLLVFIYGKISFMHIFAGYLGLFLLGTSVLSIGNLASTLAPNQWIALILSAVMLVFFLMIWMLTKIAGPVWSDLFGYLAIHHEHFRSFQDGLFSVKDFIFYLSFTLVFLELSVCSLKLRRLGL